MQRLALEGVLGKINEGEEFKWNFSEKGDQKTRKIKNNKKPNQ